MTNVISQQEYSNIIENTLIVNNINTSTFKNNINKTVFKNNIDNKVFTTVLSVAFGMDSTNHRPLNQLVHNIAESSIEERIETAGKVAKITTWQTSAKQKKIRESRLTRTDGKVTKEIYEQYADDGTTVLETLTITIPRDVNGDINGDIVRVLS